MVPGSELRVIEDVLGHLALFGVAPSYMPQVDRYLGELLAASV
jgi:homoserine O-acetyltransferase